MWEYIIEMGINLKHYRWVLKNYKTIMCMYICVTSYLITENKSRKRGRLCSPWKGGRTPRVWTIFFLHYKKFFFIIIFFTNFHFSDHYKRKNCFHAKPILGGFGSFKGRGLYCVFLFFVNDIFFSYFAGFGSYRV